MSIYTTQGDILATVYDVNGTALQNAYNIDGEMIFPDGGGSDDPYIPGRRLVFEDNFNFLDDTKWVCEIGIVRNYNTESQCYRAENVSIEDSCLVLTARRESYGGKPWTSGSISGQRLQNLLYGRYEAKIKFPNVVGAFGAFWMVGSNVWKEFVDGGRPTNHGVDWPECGELDITETIPGNAEYARANLWNYTGSSMGFGKSGSMVSSDWHIYAAEWTNEYIAIFLDGVEFKRWTFANYSESAVQAYHLPFHMIINLAIGASGGTPAASTNEMKMYVDWVRVYAPLS